MKEAELVEQGSQEWIDARLGLATSSRFRDILAKARSKGDEAAARRNYRAELVVERMTGKQVERYVTAAMDWGTQTEDLAKLAYTLVTTNLVDDVGFIRHKTLQAGASPDGLIGLDGCLEIKNKMLANHIEVLKASHMPAEHRAQVQGQIWLTGRKWCDFVSFAPELPENAQLFIERIYRDDEYIRTLQLEVALFLDEIDEDVKFLTEYQMNKAPIQ